MACPIIPFGIPEGGATEYDINTGRELFRCGTDCVKMYLTNVSGERRLVTISCAAITDAVVGDEICMQSVNMSTRDQAVINWIAKPNVDSSLPSGSVITKVGACEGSPGIIYTHTEGNLSIRILAPIEAVTNSAETAKDVALAKLGQTDTGLSWILSDVGVNVSPTDWQGGTITFMGFGVIEGGTGTNTFRSSFNWQNGRKEVGEGTITYDETDDTNVTDVFRAVLGI